MNPYAGTLTDSAAAAGRADWIHSRRFDLAFFVLSPLIALPVLLASPEPSLLSLAFGCVLGVPHYLSTYAFFFWGETAARHRAQSLVFFGGPVAIAAAVALLVSFHVPYVVQVVVYAWNTLHVARQSCGLQSIYRHRAGITDPGVKSVTNAAIISTSFALAFWDTTGYPLLHEFLTRIWSNLPRTIGLLTIAAALVSLARLALSLLARSRGPHAARRPELAFLATSLLLFHPYLWIRDANQATLGMLLGHFIQYLAIVWLVHRRRADAHAADRPSPVWLMRLSTNLPLLLGTLLAAGIVSLALRLAPLGSVQSLYAVALLALALTHFYLDGLFWAFRRPDVRASLGPFVMGRSGVTVSR